MPIFAREPATIVRQRSAWQLPKPAYGAIFLMVAVAAYGWKSYNSRRPGIDVPPQSTARVCIHDPTFAFQHAWQEILGQTKTEVRENLRIQAQRSGQETVVAISLSKLPAETIVPMVNLVASTYSQACRAQWKLHVEQAYSAATEKSRQTQRQASEAQTRFELLRDRRLRALTNLRPLPSPQPAAIENPRWTDVCRRLADLEAKRTSLLLQRTPLHPAVLEIEMLITDVRREMASIPPKIAQESPADHSATPAPSAFPPGTPTAMEVQAAQQAAQQLKQDVQEAQAAERAALTARGEELPIDLLAAEPLPPPPVPPRADTAVLGKALVLAATSIVGLGMISLGASLEPALSSVAELQALLPVPIVGVIPATHPGRRRPASALHRRLARWGWMTAGLAVLLAVAWLFLRG